MKASEEWEKDVAFLKSVEFAASLTPTSSAAILVNEMQRHPVIVRLMSQLEDSLLARLKGVVSGLVRMHAHKGCRFQYSEFMMAMAVVMGNSRHPEALKFLEELVALKHTMEYSASASVAEEVLRQRRRSLSGSTLA